MGLLILHTYAKERDTSRENAQKKEVTESQRCQRVAKHLQKVYLCFTGRERGSVDCPFCCLPGILDFACGNGHRQQVRHKEVYLFPRSRY